ncbi:MAG: type II secretion system F family protein [Candidatus Altiarchaeota archaeon]
MLNRIFITASKVYPKGYRNGVRKNLGYAGIETPVEIWLGQSLFIGFFVLIAISALARFGNPVLFYTLAFLSFMIYQVGSYSIPYFQAMNRSNAVDEMLPDLLRLMATDIRAGMTPFQAIKVSARDEFGILKHELDRASAKSLGIGSFNEALLEMCDRLNSYALNRAMRLFIRSMEGGGQLANVLDETARDISENLSLKKELLSATRTYTILILVSVLIGTPLLLTISIHFTERVNEMRESLNVSDMENFDLGMLLNMGFDPAVLENISAITILVTTLIACMLFGVIVEGKEKYGLKYAFFLVPLSLILFYAFRLASKIILK